MWKCVKLFFHSIYTYKRKIKSNTYKKILCNKNLILNLSLIITLISLFLFLFLFLILIKCNFILNLIILIKINRFNCFLIVLLLNFCYNIYNKQLYKYYKNILYAHESIFNRKNVNGELYSIFDFVFDMIFHYKLLFFIIYILIFLNIFHFIWLTFVLYIIYFGIVTYYYTIFFFLYIKTHNFFDVDYVIEFFDEVEKFNNYFIKWSNILNLLLNLPKYVAFVHRYSILTKDIYKKMYTKLLYKTLYYRLASFPITFLKIIIHLYSILRECLITCNFKNKKLLYIPNIIFYQIKHNFGFHLNKITCDFLTFIQFSKIHKTHCNNIKIEFEKALGSVLLKKMYSNSYKSSFEIAAWLVPFKHYGVKSVAIAYRDYNFFINNLNNKLNNLKIKNKIDLCISYSHSSSIKYTYDKNNVYSKNEMIDKKTDYGTIFKDKEFENNPKDFIYKSFAKNKTDYSYSSGICVNSIFESNYENFLIEHGIKNIFLQDVFKLKNELFFIKEYSLKNDKHPILIQSKKEKILVPLKFIYEKEKYLTDQSLVFLKEILPELTNNYKSSTFQTIIKDIENNPIYTIEQKKNYFDILKNEILFDQYFNETISTLASQTALQTSHKILTIALAKNYITLKEYQDMSQEIEKTWY